MTTTSSRLLPLSWTVSGSSKEVADIATALDDNNDDNDVNVDVDTNVRAKAASGEDASPNNEGAALAAAATKKEVVVAEELEPEPMYVPTLCDIPPPPLRWSHPPAHPPLADSIPSTPSRYTSANPVMPNP